MDSYSAVSSECRAANILRIASPAPRANPWTGRARNRRARRRVRTKLESLAVEWPCQPSAYRAIRAPRLGGPMEVARIAERCNAEPSAALSRT